MDEQRQSRSIGCVVWAVLLALVAIVSMFLVALIVKDWETNGSINLSWSLLPEFIRLFIIVLVVFVPIALGVGALTRPPTNRIYVTVASIFVLTVAFVGTLSWMSVFGCAMGEGTSPCKTLTESPLSFITAVACGVALGAIAGHGYWHAGRKKY